MKRKAVRTHYIGRDARTGRFMPVAVARKRKGTAIVERLGKSR